MRKKFIRNNGYRLKRVGMKWRRPRGEQNKVRMDIRGEQPRVKIGYKKTEKPQTPIITNQMDLKNTAEAYGRTKGASGSPKEVIISSGISVKTLELLRKECQNLGIKILNKRRLKKVDERIAEIMKKREERVKATRTKKDDKGKNEKDKNDKKGEEKNAEEKDSKETPLEAKMPETSEKGKTEKNVKNGATEKGHGDSL